MIRAVAKQKLCLYIAFCAGNHASCAQFLEQRRRFQRVLKASADGHDAHVEVCDAQGTQEILAGAVSNLGVCNEGQQIVDALLVYVYRHHLMAKLCQLFRHMPAKASRTDQQNIFH